MHGQTSEAAWQFSLPDEVFVRAGEYHRHAREQFVAVSDEKIQCRRRSGDNEIQGAVGVFPTKIIEAVGSVFYVRKAGLIERLREEFELFRAAVHKRGAKPLRE